MVTALRLAGAALAVLLAMSAPATGRGAGALERLEPGLWEVRIREAGAAPQRLCLASGHSLIQLRHPGPPCERFLLENGPTDTTVQYACQARGYGRTHIRRETARLVQIDSRGIANGLPFEITAEARRIGACPGG